MAGMRRLTAVSLSTFALLCAAAAAQEGPASAVPASPPARAASPAPPTPNPSPTRDDICRTIGDAAAQNGLPAAFFTRLIWQESRFDPTARSRAGAQGIAQFMPRTAAWRGLLDPFEPIEALREAASYLAELRKTFGNLGIAAASYNAGPGRVSRWLAGRATLPAETRAYVRIVTGHSADEWAGAQPPQWNDGDIPAEIPCGAIANLIAAAPPPRKEPNPLWAPWGVQLAGNWSEGKLLAVYERLRRKYAAILGDREPLVLRGRVPGLGFARGYMVRLPENTRAEADKLCARLTAAGAACAVLRNPRDSS